MEKYKNNDTVLLKMSELPKIFHATVDDEACKFWI